MAGFTPNNQHDIYLDENGNIATVDGDEEIAQNIKCALLMRKGEYEFNTDIGFQWVDKNGTTLPDILLISNIQKQLLKVNGVYQIGNVRLTHNNNQSINVELQYQSANRNSTNLSILVPLN